MGQEKTRYFSALSLIFEVEAEQTVYFMPSHAELV